MFLGMLGNVALYSTLLTIFTWLGGGYANFSDDEKIAFSEHINNTLTGVRASPYIVLWER